jgi:hypothetical protein
MSSIVYLADERWRYRASQLFSGVIGGHCYPLQNLTLCSFALKR